MNLLNKNISQILKLILVVGLYVFNQSANAQKVGVVLSGGGAAGIAHVGVLKALEENNIPIDYIAGTSMGSLVAAMYAIGYSVEEMEEIVKSDYFRDYTYGKTDEKFVYYYRQQAPDISQINIKLSTKDIGKTTIPTNFISPIPIDYAMMEYFTAPIAAANYDFDSLFIPFRCVGADITNKKQVVFKDGNLNEAVRSSVSYPFYLQPITVNGKLMFDGGIYNNFPGDVLYEDFLPDILIGSTVAGTPDPPDEDNVLSQLKAMIMDKQDYILPCVNYSVLIKPKTTIGLFEFDNLIPAIESGYLAGLEKIDDIKEVVDRRVSSEELAAKRAAFNNKKPEVVFDKINVAGVNKIQATYIKRILTKNRTKITIDELRPEFFKLSFDEKIKTMYPITKFKQETGTFDLNLKVKREKDIYAKLGFNLSNKPINQGFIGAQYNYLGNVSMKFNANAFFGKFYTSGMLKGRIDFYHLFPFYAEAGLILNRFDYFSSSNAFFEDEKPSYLIKNERFSFVDIGIPVFNKGKLVAGYSLANLKNDYYQTRNFLESDVADETRFNLVTGNIYYERSTLDRKMYPSNGTFLKFDARYIQGEEYTLPGTTAIRNNPFRTVHEWYQFKFSYDNYFNRKGRFKFGFYTEWVYSTQPLFENYTATILAAPAFNPTPETKTIFLQKFRAFQYGAAGLKTVINIRKNIDWRNEAYAFQPYREISQATDFSAKISTDLGTPLFLGTSALVYHSPIGPMSLSLNYYDSEEDKFSVLFHVGYILFNKRVME